METNLEQKICPISFRSFFRKERIAIYVRIIIAVAMLFIVLKWVDMNEAIDNIRRVDIHYVLFIYLLAFSDRYLMAYKWNKLLKLKGIALSNAEAFRIYLGATFAGTFLPNVIGGDVLRAIRTKMNGVSVDGIAASIVVERAIGLLAVTFLASSGLALLIVNHELQFLKIFYGISALLLFMIVGLIVSMQIRIFQIVKRLLSRFEKYRFIRLYLNFHSAYIELSGYTKAISIFFILSCIERYVLAIMYFSAAKSLDLPLLMIHLIAIISVVSLLESIPITINAIGVQEISYIYFFGLVGLSPTEALSLSFLMRVVGLTMLVPSGLALLYDVVMFKQLHRPVIK